MLREMVLYRWPKMPLPTPWPGPPANDAHECRSQHGANLDGDSDTEAESPLRKRRLKFQWRQVSILEQVFEIEPFPAKVRAARTPIALSPDTSHSLGCHSLCAWNWPPN